MASGSSRFGDLNVDEDCAVEYLANLGVILLLSDKSFEKL